MKILLIDDDQELLKLLKLSLEAEFLVVDTASNGEQGCFLAKTNTYNIILLDYIMPKQNGLEVCTELRKEKINTPILMLTVKADMPTKSEMFTAGIDDFLTKPFIFEEVFLRIKALTKRQENIKEKILQIDDLKLNTETHEVKRGKQAIYLTRKEFCLLLYFLENPNRVLSRALILENVWDINADPFSNTIESHILNLRRKIETKNRTKLIHTVPGRGYKLSLKAY
ncbi:MAG: response regulator transcription factor [Candidatus Pacebacteria bacterium]|nr:response regulator transcription factor [Candidatus Paceibacterota bacterium]